MDILFWSVITLTIPFIIWASFAEDDGEGWGDEPIKQNLDKLYPKYNCPKCGDWFHMPFKFCKCPRK